MKHPIVTAKKYMEYKRENGHLKGFISPEIVLVCYQQSTLKYLQEKNRKMKHSDSFSNLFFINDGRVAVLGGWGMGAPALAVKLEQLIELGVKKIYCCWHSRNVDG